MKISVFLVAIALILEQKWEVVADQSTHSEAKHAYFDLLEAVTRKYQEHADLLLKATNCLALTDMKTNLDSLNLILVVLWFASKDYVNHLKNSPEMLDPEIYRKMNKFVTLASNSKREIYDVRNELENWKVHFRNFTPQIYEPIPFLSFIPHPTLIDEEKAAIDCYATILGVQSNQTFYKLYYQAVNLITRKISAPKKSLKKESDVRSGQSKPSTLDDVIKAIRSANIIDRKEDHEMKDFRADLKKRVEVERAKTQNNWLKRVGIASVSLTAALIAAKGLIAILKGC